MWRNVWYINNIPVALPKPTANYWKKKRQLLLTYIGGELHIKVQSKPSPIKRIRLSEEAQKKEEDMKIFKSK